MDFWFHYPSVLGLLFLSPLKWFDCIMFSSSFETRHWSWARRYWFANLATSFKSDGDLFQKNIKINRTHRNKLFLIEWITNTTKVLISAWQVEPTLQVITKTNDKLFETAPSLDLMMQVLYELKSCTQGVRSYIVLQCKKWLLSTSERDRLSVEAFEMSRGCVCVFCDSSQKSTAAIFCFCFKTMQNRTTRVPHVTVWSSKFFPSPPQTENRSMA